MTVTFNCGTDFNLGQNGSLLLEAGVENLFLNLNESVELIFEFQLISTAAPSEELGFDVTIAFANSGMTCS